MECFNTPRLRTCRTGFGSFARYFEQAPSEVVMESLLGEMSPEQVKNARKFCNEDLNTRQEAVEAIKRWLQTQPHLPRTWDEQCLTNFLRSSCFSLEVCKKKLEYYFSVRASTPEFFAERDIRRPEMQHLIRLVDGVPLKKLTPDGGRVTIVKAAHPDIETPDLADLCKLTFMIGDLRIWYESGAVGDVYILDAGFPLSRHFFNVSLFTIRKFFNCVQDAYPVLIRQVHIINASSFVDFIMSSVRPFLNDTLRNAVHVHTEIETLYEFVSKDLLPEEYGGSAGKIRVLKEMWRKELEARTDWFREEGGVKANESKRRSKYREWSQYFGFESLSID